MISRLPPSSNVIERIAERIDSLAENHLSEGTRKTVTAIAMPLTLAVSGGAIGATLGNKLGAIAGPVGRAALGFSGMAIGATVGSTVGAQLGLAMLAFRR